MGTMIQNGSDIVAFLKSQHEEIKLLFGEVKTSRGEERSKAFYTLRRLLAVHETAEEEIVHPAARKAIPDGESIVKKRLEEENEAKQMLTELEKLEPDDEDFEIQLALLENAVVAHAEAEEQQEFSRLGQKMEPDRLERMRRAAEIAESVAPTRPHAGVESQAANLLAGPFAAMLDRTRDLFAGKH